jgi:hypothetical protein
MRSFALAAVIGVGMTLGGVAAAREWNDPNGRVKFDAPSGWVMEVTRAEPGTIVIAGSANNECYVMATPNDATASATVDRMLRARAPSAESWAAAANSMRPMFPSGGAVVAGQSSDTTGFWPIHKATFSGGQRPVVAALQSRPGLDLMTFCWTYGGPDASATYDAFFRSVGHPNDATWQAQATPAAAPAPTPAPAG